MATLQNIRSKGPLLIVVIGLALFAFIAGDAWKVLQPHQSHDAGEVNGDAISAQEYQSLVEEYTEVVKLMRGTTALNDDETNQVRDEVWRSYVNNKLIEKEAKALGIKVTTAEIQDILKAGVHPLLQQTPFRNPQTGRFDKDMLNKFLVEYSKMDQAQMPAQYIEQYQSMFKYWSFIEKTLRESRLAEKYQALVSKALLSNPVEAQNAFDARVNQYDLLMAAVPYSTVSDSTITVKDSELKDLYNKKKEQFKQYVESRDIKYIDVQVTASAEDRAAIQKEVVESTEHLATTTNDYTSFVRSAGSETLYTDLFLNKTAFPADVVARLDSVTIGAVYGPYYNVADNTINSFKLVAKAAAPDSVEFRQIQIVAEDAVKTKALADSVYTAIKGGASFADIAKKYGQTGETTWLTAAQYEGGQLAGENLKFISAINDAPVNELSNIDLGQANLILQVTAKKAVKEKYKVAVIKREVEFSKETYNRAYNDFSQFVAANPTLDKMVANAEEAGYKLLERQGMYSSEHKIGDVRGTKEALRWIFSAKAGEVSSLYECGDSDHMIVVGLVAVTPEGYRPLNAVQDQLRAEIIKDKKAEKIMADMKAANASTLDQYNALTGAVSDSLKMVTFAAPAYVAGLRSSEPLVGAYASVAEVNKVSAPIKGNAGVFVLQMYAKNKLAEEFNAKEEEATLVNMHARFASRIMNDLYLKGKVKDTRYLFF
ncbi:peptidylprolyl isomerase [Bacteroides reticulotermitis]|uniref:Peptidyl-prolyl cis-trans isomerase D n=1 Tax=Bacteroides reticulotermitis TaxID=1133319 RepID=A0A840D7V1_9BACE|nr:peptidylprolyl isomerase [Bacteroides reticulotermitis]MBB4044533.1 peptidyl-prolyl cis-trans isomerase D [Bacteroides reticulotermitis]HJD76638.1 SurA N-terminal domain-containing protein [Bacteroides reticulotermitis]